MSLAVSPARPMASCPSPSASVAPAMDCRRWGGVGGRRPVCSEPEVEGGHDPASPIQRLRESSILTAIEDASAAELNHPDAADLSGD